MNETSGGFDAEPEYIDDRLEVSLADERGLDDEAAADDDTVAAMAYEIRSQITERTLHLFDDATWNAMVEQAIEDAWGPES